MARRCVLWHSELRIHSWPHARSVPYIRSRSGIKTLRFIRLHKSDSTSLPASFITGLKQRLWEIHTKPPYSYLKYRNVSECICSLISLQLCCCLDVIYMRFAARVQEEKEAMHGAQTKQQRWMFPEYSLALRPPRSAPSGRMSWACRRITDARRYFHFRLEFHHSSFSLSVIPADYKLGLILILRAISFSCDNSTIFPELMVERLESHISCKKKSDRVRKVRADFWREALTLPWRYIELSLLSQMEARKQKYGISSLTKFHFQSYFYKVCFY